MKLLTGKCKSEFLKYTSTNTGNFIEELNIMLEKYNENKLILNALIIDFFDSVGIFIEQKFFKYPDKSGGFWSCFIVDNYGVFLDDYIKFPKKETRVQATEEAIKKANELFNNR